MQFTTPEGDYVDDIPNVVNAIIQRIWYKKIKPDVAKTQPLRLSSYIPFLSDDLIYKVDDGFKSDLAAVMGRLNRSDLASNNIMETMEIVKRNLIAGGANTDVNPVLADILQNITALFTQERDAYKELLIILDRALYPLWAVETADTSTFDYSLPNLYTQLSEQLADSNTRWDQIVRLFNRDNYWGKFAEMKTDAAKQFFNTLLTNETARDAFVKKLKGVENLTSGFSKAEYRRYSTLLSIVLVDDIAENVQLYDDIIRELNGVNSFEGLLDLLKRMDVNNKIHEDTDLDNDEDEDEDEDDEGDDQADDGDSDNDYEDIEAGDDEDDVSYASNDDASEESETLFIEAQTMRPVGKKRVTQSAPLPYTKEFSEDDTVNDDPLIFPTLQGYYENQLEGLSNKDRLIKRKEMREEIKNLKHVGFFMELIQRYLGKEDRDKYRSELGHELARLAFLNNDDYGVNRVLNIATQWNEVFTDATKLKEYRGEWEAFLNMRSMMRDFMSHYTELNKGRHREALADSLKVKVTKNVEDIDNALYKQWCQNLAIALYELHDPTPVIDSSERTVRSICTFLPEFRREYADVVHLILLAKFVYSADFDKDYHQTSNPSSESLSESDKIVLLRSQDDSLQKYQQWGLFHKSIQTLRKLQKKLATAVFSADITKHDFASPKQNNFKLLCWLGDHKLLKEKAYAGFVNDMKSEKRNTTTKFQNKLRQLVDFLYLKAVVYKGPGYKNAVSYTWNDLMPTLDLYINASSTNTILLWKLLYYREVLSLIRILYRSDNFLVGVLCNIASRKECEKLELENVTLSWFFDFVDIDANEANRDGLQRLLTKLYEKTYSRTIPIPSFLDHQNNTSVDPTDDYHQSAVSYDPILKNSSRADIGPFLTDITDYVKSFGELFLCLVSKETPRYMVDNPILEWQRELGFVYPLQLTTVFLPSSFNKWIDCTLFNIRQRRFTVVNNAPDLPNLTYNNATECFGKVFCMDLHGRIAEVPMEYDGMSFFDNPNLLFGFMNVTKAFQRKKTEKKDVSMSGTPDPDDKPTVRIIKGSMRIYLWALVDLSPSDEVAVRAFCTALFTDLFTVHVTFITTPTPVYSRHMPRLLQSLVCETAKSAIKASAMDGITGVDDEKKAKRLFKGIYKLIRTSLGVEGASSQFSKLVMHLKPVQ